MCSFHSFCSKGCAGADDFTAAEGDPDGEMLSNTPAEGGDFFVEATGDINGSQEGDHNNESLEGDGEGEGGEEDGEGVVR